MFTQKRFFIFANSIKLSYVNASIFGFGLVAGGFVFCRVLLVVESCYFMCKFLGHEVDKLGNDVFLVAFGHFKHAKDLEKSCL